MIAISITALNYFHKAHFMGSGRIKPVAEFGCYYCAKIYRLDEHPIREWVDGGYTALCPVCGIDSVIPRLRKIDFDVRDMEELYTEMFS
ncbi:hypothetical protein IPM19_01865 [bacterium]|nr:MAG: hypothetical protein IPM19_01865 [bacterium]